MSEERSERPVQRGVEDWDSETATALPRGRGKVERSPLYGRREGCSAEGPDNMRLVMVLKGALPSSYTKSNMQKHLSIWLRQ